MQFIYLINVTRGGADLLRMHAQVREALSRKVSRERVGAELEGMFQGAPARRSILCH